VSDTVAASADTDPCLRSRSYSKWAAAVDKEAVAADDKAVAADTAVADNYCRPGET